MSVYTFFLEAEPLQLQRREKRAAAAAAPGRVERLVNQSCCWRPLAVRFLSWVLASVPAVRIYLRQQLYSCVHCVK